MYHDRHPSESDFEYLAIVLFAELFTPVVVLVLWIITLLEEGQQGGRNSPGIGRSTDE